MNSKFGATGLAAAGVLGMALLGSPALVWAQADAPAPAATADEKLPSAKEVMDKFIQATGGRAAYEKHTSRVITSTIEIPAQNLKGTSTLTQVAPNKMEMKAEFPGMGSQTIVSDGENVWESNSMMGERLYDGDERMAQLRQATFNSELQWEKLYKDVKVVGSEDVNGKPAWKVEFTTGEGQTSTQFYDKETGLLTKMTSTLKTQMGEVPMESSIEGWQEFDGLKMPTKTVQSVMGMQMIMTISDVKHGAEVPADKFAMPDSVKQLKKDPAAPAAPAEAPKN
ncbi:MAG: hypothetical protein SFZ24_07045 [Planctomycetota bacterium]|nr:hypothetical protein [Planctomycetota bacterium]